MFRSIVSVLICVGFCCLRVFGENKIPRRVVCFAPNYVEILIELGLKDRIVGVTTSSDYLEDVKDVDKVGFYMQPNIEKIVSLKPDLVLVSSFVGQKSVVEKLTSLGISVAVFETQGIEEIFKTVERIGELFGVQERSQKLLFRMQEVIEETKSKTKQVSKPRVYVEVGYDPIFTCGRGSFIHDLVEIAGGENIAGDIHAPFPRVSSEFILGRDPEVIILPYMGRSFSKEALRKRSGWAGISAVRSGRVYDDIGFSVITIPSPRLILDGLPELLKRIHPEISKETEHGNGTN